jgi:hypothetical protein
MFSSSDLKFILTFIAGMAGFWLSGHIPALLPAKFLPNNYLVVFIITLTLALIIYGLGMALWLLIVLGRDRALKPIIIPTVLIMVLALISSLVLTRVGPGLAKNATGLALLTFGLYLGYGLYYVIGWFVAKRLARSE